MKLNLRFVLLVAVAAVFLTGAVTMARQLGAREARQKIAEALGLVSADDVHIRSISAGQLGGDAIVEARFEAAFHFTTDKNGNWVASEIRVGDRRWESIELIRTAVQKEKILRTTADMRTLATALEAFLRERGFYVAADTGSALVDNLAPRYLKSVIRLDAWSNEFHYKGAESSYRLSSSGPDGRHETDDDIAIEDGALVKGAVE